MPAGSYWHGALAEGVPLGMYSIFFACGVARVCVGEWGLGGIEIIARETILRFFKSFMALNRAVQRRTERAQALEAHALERTDERSSVAMVQALSRATSLQATSLAQQMMAGSSVQLIKGGFHVHFRQVCFVGSFIYCVKAYMTLPSDRKSVV